jgi:hypothetical protein
MGDLCHSFHVAQQMLWFFDFTTAVDQLPESCSLVRKYYHYRIVTEEYYSCVILIRIRDVGA